MKYIRLLFFILLILTITTDLYSEDKVEEAVTLSVMKFKTISEQDIGYIGESFADALTTKLTHIKDLRIYERSQFNKISSELQMNVDSAELFDSDTVQDIGKIVAIDYMALGTLTLIQDKLRLGFRLVDVKSSRAILSEELDGRYPDDIFDLQDRLAMIVVQSLKLKISELEKEKVLKNPTNDIDAYEYYNRSLSGASNRERIELLRKSLEKDPDFTLARHCLAETYYQNQDYSDSIREYQEILEKNPADFKAQYNLGLLWFDLNKIPAAEKQLQKAADLQAENPDVWYHLALLREFDTSGERLTPEVDKSKVKKAYQKVLAVQPKHLETHYALGILNAIMAAECSEVSQQKVYLEEAVSHLQLYLEIFPEVFNAAEVEQNVQLLKGSIQQINEYLGS